MFAIVDALDLHSALAIACETAARTLALTHRATKANVSDPIGKNCRKDEDEGRGTGDEGRGTRDGDER